MEECMICFDLTDNNHFIVFSCKHKVCSQCYPKLTHCPLCNIELQLRDVCYPAITIPGILTINGFPVLQCLCISGTVFGFLLFLKFS